MKFSKEGESLVLTLPLKQKDYDAIGQYIGDVSNLVGIVAGNNFSISQLIDMNYCGKSLQEGSPIIRFDTKEQLEEVCKQFDLDIWTHGVCAYCEKTIYGSFTFGDKGNMCFSCEMIIKAEEKTQ